ncbi:MAG: glycosyltransferase family 4 protein [Thermoplasmata archaeon]|nr:MAG: glycosyltransferase family 4 protein [Thermoplasmata archaeon]
MKINWITGHFYPETGGVEKHVEQIARMLITKGHEVVVHASAITVNNKKLPLIGELGEIRIQRYKPKFNLSFYFSMLKPDLKEGDIVVMEGYPSLTNDHIRKKYQTRFPLVVFIQGAVMPFGGLASFMKRIYDSVYGVKTLKTVDRIIAMTELEKNWCMEKGIDGSKIEIIPNGIPEEAFFEYDPQISKKKYNLKRYVLFIGRMYQDKAPSHLVSALSKLHDDFEDLGIIFVGPDQGEVAKIKTQAKQFGLENRIIYAGKVSDTEKYELLSGCEFFALPSKFEAQGIVFLEAWAQKKAVIGTEVGGVPYVVKDRVRGLLYEYGDIDALAGHIRYLLENPAESKRLGERGFRHVDSECRWENVVVRIERLYLDSIEDFGKTKKTGS